MTRRERPLLRHARPVVIFIAVAVVVWMVSRAVGPRDVDINVRWRPNLTDRERESLEAELHLAQGAYIEGTTWTYRLELPSRANIRALVLHDAVEDTAHLHRTQYRPELAQYHALWFGLYAFLAGVTAVILDWLVRRLRARVPPVLDGRAGAGARRQTMRGPAPSSGPLEHAQPRPRVWTAFTLLVLAPAVVMLSLTQWQTPYPIRETVGILEDILRADSVFDHLDPARRSWYRPLFFLSLDVVTKATDSLENALLAFRVLEIAPILLLVWLFVRWLRPATLRESAAALCATAVLVGTAAFRDNLEIPLLYTLVGMPLAVLVWRVLESRPRAWTSVVLVTAVTIAVGFKEQGLVLVPLVLMAPLVRAPGASRGAAVAVALLTAVYVAVRWSTRGVLQTFEQDVTIGFTTWAASDANVRFAESFLWVYVYNALAVVGNLLFSEPTAGRFQMLQDAWAGSVPPSALVEFTSSAALTGLIVWWGVAVLRRDWGREWTVESRLAVFLVIACGVSGALAFSYPRDRHGGMALVLYAFAAYYAIRMALDRAALLLTWRRLGVAIALASLALGWQLRLLGTVRYAQRRAQHTHYTWIVDRAEERARSAERPVYLDTLETLAPQGLAAGVPRPRGYPAWLTTLLTSE